MVWKVILIRWRLKETGLMWLSISLNLMLGEIHKHYFFKNYQQHVFCGQTVTWSDLPKLRCLMPFPCPLSVPLCASYWCVSLSLSLSLLGFFLHFDLLIFAKSLPPWTVCINNSYRPLSLSPSPPLVLFQPSL